MPLSAWVLPKLVTLVAAALTAVTSLPGPERDRSAAPSHGIPTRTPDRPAPSGPAEDSEPSERQSEDSNKSEARTARGARRVTDQAPPLFLVWYEYDPAQRGWVEKRGVLVSQPAPAPAAPPVPAATAVSAPVAPPVSSSSRSWRGFFRW